MASRPYVCPWLCSSVTLKYRDHIGWKSSKIIWRLVSLACSSLTPTYHAVHGTTPREQVTTRNFGRTAIGYWSTEKWRQDSTKVTIEDNRKSRTCFWLVPKSTTYWITLKDHYALFQKTCVGLNSVVIYL